jgi:UDP-glucose 4-epimerase
VTILVTGGAGYIGSHMVHALVDAGESVVVLDNLTTGFDSAVAPGVPLVIGDTGDQARVAALMTEHGVDAVIHFAASIVVPDSVRDPPGYYRNNTANTRSLIETAVKHGVRHFIFSSTAAVYGNPERTPVREDDPMVPTSPYGSSKLMTEIMLRDAGAAHGLRHVILRYFNVAGADPLGRAGQLTKGATHLIKVAVEAALGRRPKVVVFGTDYPTLDGTGIRDYIHVADLVAAHSDVLAYLRGGGASTTLNCGYGRGFSVLDVIETVKRVSGADFEVEFAGRRAGDPAQVVAACDRARSTLGWQPQFDDLTAIVSHAFTWERGRLTPVRRTCRDCQRPPLGSRVAYARLGSLKPTSRPKRASRVAGTSRPSKHWGRPGRAQSLFRTALGMLIHSKGALLLQSCSARSR